jgi:hypothetical protein
VPVGLSVQARVPVGLSVQAKEPEGLSVQTKECSLFLEALMANLL